jgi:hypothetical protein
MRAGLTVLVVCLTVTGVSASIGPPVPIETRARGAASVVIASVVDVQSRFDVNEFGDRLIVSDVMLQVEETLKGSRSASVSVTVEGGTIGDISLAVSDMPTLRRGERAVFFLEQASSGVVRPHRRGLGVVMLDATNRVPGTTLTADEIRHLVRAAQ